ncbi:MAG TPA: hypothetical protein VGS80_00285 [Ktedonobacterales bacterium]|nr:hypothetical protein [Ktedonobacterales bacterium]
MGLNYEPAKSIVARAEQAAGVRPHSRPPATSQLVVHVVDAEQKAITVSRLRDVLDATPEAGEDDWACAILAQFAFWEAHQATPPEGEAA